MALFHFAIPPVMIAVRSVLMYFGLLLSLRVVGKREVGQFTLFDLVLVLLVANAIQPAMTGPDTSLGGGLVILASLFAVNSGVAWLTRRSSWLRDLTEGRPTLIARNGRWLWPAVRKEGISRSELDMALREHDLQGVSHVSLAVLEPDGTISILKRGQSLKKGRHQVARAWPRPLPTP